MRAATTLRSWLVVVSMAVLPATAPAQETQLASIYTSSGSNIDRVVVDKSARRLMLMRDGYAVRTYPIALGRNPEGPKRTRGDGRTPEGVYALDWRNPDSRFYLSIHVSYPNAADRMRADQLSADPGGMIMIHGRPNIIRTGDYGLRPDWTEGCIAVSNGAMDEIWSMVEDGTVIEILP